MCLQKKKKRDKNKSSNEESTLGTIDQSVLEQAKTNLGLPIEQDSATETKPKEKKKKKKDKNKEPKVEVQPEGTRDSRALSYLQLWANSRESWRFRKVSQVHLLHIMYKPDKMLDEDFVMMLQYLEELKGKGREKTREEAEKIVKDDEDNDVESKEEEENKKEEESPSQVKLERARQIIQLLS